MELTVSLEDVIMQLRHGKETYSSRDAQEGCCIRLSSEYICHYGLAVPLKDQLDAYAKASLRGIKSAQYNTCMLSLNEDLPEELNYSLVWMEVGYPENSLSDRFLDDLFDGFDKIANKFELVEA